VSAPRPGVTESALLGGRVRVLQPAKGYRTAIDAVLLAAAVPAGAGETVLELGTGVGAAVFCLATRVPGVQITALEREPALAELARLGVAANGFEARVGIVTGDVLSPPVEIAGSGFDHVLFNPPYAAAGTSRPSPDPLKHAATVEGEARLADWLRCAAFACKPGGTVTVIHLFARLGEVTAGLAAQGFGAQQVLALAPKADGKPKRAIVRAQKGAAAGVTECTPLVLHEANGDFTAVAEKVLRHAESLL
jgi:tRNA1(Val) A37 N6-methylase TrmN6